MPLARPRYRLAASLVLTIACSGCTNDWALGGLPSPTQPTAHSSRAGTPLFGGSPIPIASGGGEALLFTAVLWGAVGAVALAVEGLRRLFGGS